MLDAFRRSVKLGTGHAVVHALKEDVLSLPLAVSWTVSTLFYDQGCSLFVAANQAAKLRRTITPLQPVSGKPKCRQHRSIALVIAPLAYKPCPFNRLVRTGRMLGRCLALITGGQRNSCNYHKRKCGYVDKLANGVPPTCAGLGSPTPLRTRNANRFSPSCLTVSYRLGMPR